MDDGVQASGVAAKALNAVDMRWRSSSVAMLYLSAFSLNSETRTLSAHIPISIVSAKGRV